MASDVAGALTTGIADAASGVGPIIVAAIAAGVGVWIAILGVRFAKKFFTSIAK